MYKNSVRTVDGFNGCADGLTTLILWNLTMHQSCGSGSGLFGSPGSRSGSGSVFKKQISRSGSEKNEPDPQHCYALPTCVTKTHYFTVYMFPGSKDGTGVVSSKCVQLLLRVDINTQLTPAVPAIKGAPQNINNLNYTYIFLEPGTFIFTLQFLEKCMLNSHLDPKNLVK